MDKNPADEILITALAKRFNEERYPRALELEKKVSRGETLNEHDMVFLETVLNDAKYILRFSDKYPEYQDIMTKVVQMYSDITKMALENEKNQEGST